MESSQSRSSQVYTIKIGRVSDYTIIYSSVLQLYENVLTSDFIYECGISWFTELSPQPVGCSLALSLIYGHTLAQRQSSIYRPCGYYCGYPASHSVNCGTPQSQILKFRGQKVFIQLYNKDTIG